MPSSPPPKPIYPRSTVFGTTPARSATGDLVVHLLLVQGASVDIVAKALALVPAGLPAKSEFVTSRRSPAGRSDLDVAELIDGSPIGSGLASLLSPNRSIGNGSTRLGTDPLTVPRRDADDHP